MPTVDLATELRKGSASRYTLHNFGDTGVLPLNFAPVVALPPGGVGVTGGQNTRTTLGYTSRSGIFEGGEQVVGGTSGAIARIGHLATVTDGTLTVSGVSGTFTDNEDFTTINANLVGGSGTLVGGLTGGDTFTFTAGTTPHVDGTITGDASGETATIIGYTATAGALQFSHSEGTWQNGETITGSRSGATATVSGTESAPSTVTKTGSLTLGNPHEWALDGPQTYALTDGPSLDTSGMYEHPGLPFGADVPSSNLKSGAFGILGLDTGIDPLTEAFTVKCTYHLATWDDYWTQSGPYCMLDPTGTHNTDMGWGHLRDQTVEPNGAHYMIEVFSMAKTYWLDSAEYDNTNNGPLTEVPGVSGEIEVDLIGNGDGTFDVVWDVAGSPATLFDNITPPAAYTTPTGILGCGIIEISNTPGFTGYGTEVCGPGFLDDGGAGAPLLASHEWPGMTVDCEISW